MTNISAISFDCAGTLLKSKWNPATVAVEATSDVIDRPLQQNAHDVFTTALRNHHEQLLEANRSKEVLRVQSVWRTIFSNFAQGLNLTSDEEHRAFGRAQDLVLSPGSELFIVYDDVLPILDWLATKPLRLIVLSNWDMSLHEILAAKGLAPYFEFSIASLEEGVEKPDKRLFKIAQDKLGCDPQEILHIGDDLIDDLQGARQAGWQALHLDRGRKESKPPFIHDLRILKEWLA